MATPEVVAELRRIQVANGGILKAAVVVQEAEDDESPLHRYFEWDDSEAGRRFRIWQARQLIRVSVGIIEADKDPMRVFVSLKTDRTEPGGGYRGIVEVLSDPERRQQMLYEALEDLRVFEKKYRRLTELSPVFEAARKVVKRSRRKGKRVDQPQPPGV